MTTDPQPTAAQTPPSPAKQPRHPVERVVVWGGIILLGLVAAIEFRAKMGYSMSFNALNAAAIGEERELTLADARGMIKFAPKVSGPVQVGTDDVYTYRWFSLFKPGAYEIQLRASRGDAEPLFLGFTTPNPPPVPEPVYDESEGPSDEETASEEMPSMPPPAHGEAGTGGGRGPRPNPIRDAIDKDADFSLSAEELAATTESLGALDANQDGAISAEELGSGEAAAAGEGGRSPNRFLEAIDADGDGNISAEELKGASAALLKLDVNGDGVLNRDDFRRPEGGRQDEGGRTRGRPAGDATPPAPAPSAPATEPAGPNDGAPAEKSE